MFEIQSEIVGESIEKKDEKTKLATKATDLLINALNEQKEMHFRKLEKNNASTVPKNLERKRKKKQSVQKSRPTKKAKIDGILDEPSDEPIDSFKKIDDFRIPRKHNETVTSEQVEPEVARVHSRLDPRLLASIPFG